MLQRSEDNRLLFTQNAQTTELLGYVNQATLQDLRQQLLLIELNYQREVFGLCPFIYLSRDEYRVLKLVSHHYSLKTISQKLSLSLNEVQQLVQALKNHFQLWALDQRYQLPAPVQTMKVLVNDSSFSSLLTAEETDNLETILPHDNGQQTQDAWSNFAAADILQVLTKAQRQTAILLEQGYTPAEIAQQLGVSTQEVYQKILRMRAKLTKLGIGVNGGSRKHKIN